MNYNTQGGSLFCIVPLPVVVKCPFGGLWNFNTELVYDFNVIKMFFLFSLIRRRALNAPLRGLSVSLLDLSLGSAAINISVFINTPTDWHKYTQKPAPISYCHDLLFPVSLTWLARFSGVSFFFYGSHDWLIICSVRPSSHWSDNHWCQFYRKEALLDA